MEQAIRNFNRQFLFRPLLVNSERLARKRGFVVGGMGGSHLAAGLLSGLKPEVDIIVHRDYGIPSLSNKARRVTRGNLAQRGGASRAIREHANMRVSESELSERLFIASSYSGNTEETIDFARTARKKRYAVATISVGGKLLAFAQENTLPHIVLPDTGIQPRSALGFSMIALAAFIGDARLIAELHALASKLKPAALEKTGVALARKLKNQVPIIYASGRNSAVAYNWKIKFNETAKIPAFYNVFPELNHNEMTGFDIISKTKKLSERFHFIFLTDTADHPKIQKRMAVCKKLYETRGLPVTEVPLKGRTALKRVFTSLIIADWAAFYSAKLYGTEPEQVPMVEEFKRLIA